MSLILDALKKLDREKVSRRKGMPDLAAEVLRADSTQPRKKVPLLLLALSLTALAASGITYAIIGKPGFLTKPPPPSAGILPGPGKQVASASLGTGTQAKPSSPVPGIPPAPGQKDSSPSAAGPHAPAQTSPPAPTTPPTSPGRKEAASGKSGALSKPSPLASAGPPAPGKRVAAVPPKPGPSAKPSLGAPSSRPPSVEKAPPAPPDSGVRARPSPSAPAPPLESRQKISPSPLSPEPARGLPSGAKPERSKAPFKTEGRPPAPSPGDKNEIPKGTFRETKAPPEKIPKPGEPAAGSSAAETPTLKISGIVWNEAPANRRAVINGSFISEGSTIEGVKVVEIFPTKVLFLHQGRYFEKSIF